MDSLDRLGVCMQMPLSRSTASRSTVVGICLAVAATPFAYRGIVGEWPGVTNARRRRGDTRVALGGHRGIHVRQSIRLEVPRDVVYRFWRRLENLPRFMTRSEERRGGKSVG